jgi:hypothetical protein
VIVAAVDEHLYHPRLTDYLARCRRRGVTYVPALGLQMMTPDFPGAGEHLASTRTTGAPYSLMSKLRIWSPDALEETNFGIGGHDASPVGRLRLPWRDELLLLHYKLLGIDRMRTRSAELLDELTEHDRAQQWGYHYRSEHAEDEWAHFADRLVDLRDPRYVPWIDHTKGRWWRRPGDRASRLRRTVELTRAAVARLPSSARGRTPLQHEERQLGRDEGAEGGDDDERRGAAGRS